MGAAGCFFIMLPAGLKFAYNLNKSLGLTTLWSATEYYSTVAWGVFGMGLIFEFPLILVVMQTLGIIETKTLKRWRKIALIVILLLAGLVAPSPDFISMLMVAAPMVVMYEGSLIVGAWTRKRRLAKQARKEAEEAANNAG
jgi:sec-independent protein translocase protein TatC